MMDYYNADKDTVAKWVTGLIARDRVDLFYKNAAWLRTRAEVLRDNHYECQMCKAKGVLTEANTVHHMQELRKRPDLALCRDNLMPVCPDCHYQIHHGREANGGKVWDDEQW